MDHGDRVEGIEAWMDLFAVPADMAQVYRDELLATVEPQWRDWFTSVGKGFLPRWCGAEIPPPEYMLPEAWLEGPTPLIYCAWLGRLEWVEHLLARGDSPAACDAWGRPAFFAAIAAGHIACANTLRPEEFNLNEPIGVLGELALHIVALHDNPPPSRVDLMDWLLAIGADPSVKNRAGETALQCSPVYMELQAQAWNRQPPGKPTSPAKMSVCPSGSCLGHHVAMAIFEKLLLLTDVSEEFFGFRNREFEIELGERKTALVERKEMDKELADGSSKSGGKEGGRL